MRGQASPELVVKYLQFGPLVPSETPGPAATSPSDALSRPLDPVDGKVFISGIAESTSAVALCHDSTAERQRGGVGRRAHSLTPGMNGAEVAVKYQPW